MFGEKQATLFTKGQAKTSATVSSKSKNAFVTGGRQKAAQAFSGNGAPKYSTTGNSFVDQFGSISSYKAPRPFATIESDCEALWAENKLLAVCFIFYLRMITRVVQLFDGTSTSISQKGAELKHESIMRMLWLSQKAPKTFIKNIGLFVSVGSWQDIIKMFQYDLVYHGWDKKVLNWTEMGDLILSGLKNEKTCNLVKKYLPQIKANSTCHTIEAQADNIIAKWICSLLYGPKENSYNYAKYRKMKSSGTAHQWQQLISQCKFNEIDFNKIHGRALNKLVKGKFLGNNGLTEVYAKWIGKDETVAKFTGFVHELFAKLPGSLSSMPKYEQDTINKQFETVVLKAKDVPTDTKLIVVRDTSSSMTYNAVGTTMTSYNVAKAMALYFSAFLEGPFADAYIEFDNKATLREWKGTTALERWFNDRADAYGTTNFLGVIDLFIELKRKGVPLADFPTGIVCMSDMQFNVPGNDAGQKTNFIKAKEKLKAAGFPQDYIDNFVFVFWWISNSYYGKLVPGFETFGDVPNVFYLSGYSASVVSFLLTGKATNAAELFGEAMNQEVLGMIQL